MIEFEYKGTKIDKMSVNGINIQNFKFKIQNKNRVIEINDKQIADIFLNLSANDFDDDIKVQINNYFEWLSFDHYLSFNGMRKWKSLKYCTFVCFPAFRKGVISSLIDPDIYLQEFIEQIKHRNGFKVYFEERSVRILFISLSDRALKESLQRFETLLKEINKIVLNRIKNNNFSSAHISFFNFPDELKIPCEQYLLYFAQFLQDLGINATSNLKEEAGKVLFSVTPTDDVEALDKIREALAVYLNLPSSPIVFDDSIKSMRMQQQIENLQHAQKMAEMEFRLAQKVIESQDKLLEQKDLTIEQQSKIIEKITNKSVMIDSAENKEELEEIFDGIKVGKSKFLAEQLGLHLNPATALKSVGEKIVGKVEILSLDLDKED